MAKINRYDGNLAAFASQADTNRRTTFGTEITGDDTLDGNITADYLTGWQIVGPNEFPTLEDFNAAFFTIGRLMAYVHQVGMPEWNGEQEFHGNSMANRNGVIYVCRTDNHVSATPPESDSTNWRLPRASDIGYDNTDSGLTAEQVQAAIDELADEKLDATSGSIDGLFASPNSPPVKTALNAEGSAPIYACRAWVNFNGDTGGTIRASGNVSSITDNGVGNYDMNLTTPTEDNNSSCPASVAHSSPISVARDVIIQTVQMSPSVVNINTYTVDRIQFDATFCQVSVFR